MYSGRLIFSQLMDFLPVHQFRRCVNRYHGNYHMKTFSCLDQFLCMTFAQLSYCRGPWYIPTLGGIRTTVIPHPGAKIIPHRDHGYSPPHCHKEAVK